MWQLFFFPTLFLEYEQFSSFVFESHFLESLNTPNRLIFVFNIFGPNKLLLSSFLHEPKKKEKMVDDNKVIFFQHSPFILLYLFLYSFRIHILTMYIIDIHMLLYNMFICFCHMLFLDISCMFWLYILLELLFICQIYLNIYSHVYICILFAKTFSKKSKYQVFHFFIKS